MRLLIKFLVCISLFCIEKSFALSDLPGIDKIYVISLDRTPERLQFIKQQMNRFHIEFEHFHAVDGKYMKIIDINGKELSKMRKGCTYFIEHPKYEGAGFHFLFSKRHLTPGECGCFLSHRAVWQEIAKKNIKRAVILEDDLTLFDNFKDTLSESVPHIPQDADVFFLDIGMNKPFAKNSYYVSAGFWLSGFLNTPSPYFAKLKKSHRVWGTHAYCITSDSAKKLLKLTEAVTVPVDIAIINHADKLNLYVSKIKLLSGGAFDSEIDKLGRWK